MSIWKKLSSLFGGDGPVQGIADVVDQFVHTKEEKAALKLKLKELEHTRAMEAQRIALETDAEFNQRIKDLEGTGTDLRQAGFPGRVVLFLRGAQRPLWGFLVMVMDIMVFSGRWSLPPNSQLESAFWVVNFLVLGFLFGERALQNVLPFFKQLKEK
jgi:hypothetical protein